MGFTPWRLLCVLNITIMKTPEENSKGSNRTTIAIVALSLLLLGSFAATSYFESEKQAAINGLNESKLIAERLLGEKLQLEKDIVDLGVRLQSGTEALGSSEQQVAELHRRVEAAIKHSTGLEAAARRSNRLAREVADLSALKQRMEVQLATAHSNAQDLQEQLEHTTGERDALTAQLEQHRDGARMVNNAEVDAVRGRKGRLTVVARRANEIRMAFDLPEGLAKGASFKIITPSGRNYSGADPAVSMSVDESDAEATASLATVPLATAKERASRVHLTFKPEQKLEAGTYRIDVMSEGAYLNTVLLNLR